MIPPWLRIVFSLLKVLDRRTEHSHVILAGNIFVKTVAYTLGVTHFADNASVGRRDTLYGKRRIVRIEVNVVSRSSAKIDILRCDLTVLRQAHDLSSIGKEPALTVRYSHRIDIARARFHEPRRFVRCDPRSYKARLVTSDRVVGERRTRCVRIDDLSVRNETELNERLEAIADTCHKTVAVVKKLRYLFLDERITEERRNEFARTVRLVAAREAARDKDHLYSRWQ